MTPDVGKLKVAELKEELLKRGLSGTGVKAVLVERLTKALEDEGKAVKEDVPPCTASEPPVTEAVAEAKPVDPKPQAPAVLTKEERIAERKKRFGDAVLSEADKLKARAERFHTVDPLNDSDRIKQRAQRFGIQTAETLKEKEINRAKRFGLSIPELEAEKKKARMERFKQPPPPLAKEVLNTQQLADLIKKR